MEVYTAEGGSILVYIISGAVVGFILYSFFIAKKNINKPPSENIKILDDQTFDQTVSKGVSLVDFWAEWCGPCKVQGPIVDEVADELHEKANICKLDIDHNKQTAAKYGIQSIPTILVFKDGKVVDKFVGVKPKQQLMKSLQNHLS